MPEVFQSKRNGALNMFCKEESPIDLYSIS